MITIGRRDKIDLPDLELFDLEAKIDTGAFGCALHCHHIEVIKRNGQSILNFDLLDPGHPDYEKKIFSFENFSEKAVKSTNGESEKRFTIKTELVIFKKSFTVEFSLTNREQMKVPVLLGRKLLRNHFLVDVDKKNISYNLKTKNK